MNLKDIERDFKNSSNSDLINYIFKRHHSFLKAELLDLSQEILTVYNIYFKDDGDFLEEVHILVNNLKTNFEAHIIKEEKRLFLHIKDYEARKDFGKLENIVEEIESIEKNNNEIEYSIKELRRVTKDYTRARDQHLGYETLYRKLEELEVETQAHFKLERELLYRRLKDEYDKYNKEK